jgi:actin-related protein 5
LASLILILSHVQPRIPFGASQATEYLLKLVQMKYSSFPHRLVSVQANWMLRTFCAFSSDYPTLLRTLNDPLALRAAERVVQFPFAAYTETDKTQEELDRITERRREQGRKLQELAAAKRLEKLVNQEAELAALSELLAQRESMSKRDWLRALEADGFDDEAVLQSTMKKLDASTKKARRKQAGEVENEEPEEEPSWPMLDVPDDELDDDQKKEKKKQRLLKAGYDARIRNREQKAIEAAGRAADVKREEEERERDLTGWSNKLRREHDVSASLNL